MSFAIDLKTVISGVFLGGTEFMSFAIDRFFMHVVKGCFRYRSLNSPCRSSAVGERHARWRCHAGKPHRDSARHTGDIRAHAGSRYALFKSLTLTFFGSIIMFCFDETSRPLFPFDAQLSLLILVEVNLKSALFYVEHATARAAGTLKNNSCTD